MMVSSSTQTHAVAGFIMRTHRNCFRREVAPDVSASNKTLQSGCTPAPSCYGQHRISSTEVAAFWEELRASFAEA